MATVQTSRFGAWLRGVDAFAAQLLLMQREPDVCDQAAAEVALDGGDTEDEGDPDGDETDETDGDDTSEPAPAAIAH